MEEVKAASRILSSSDMQGFLEYARQRQSSTVAVG
jgi:hypothetical protein